MDDYSYRQNFDRDKKSGIRHHSWREHVKLGEVAKFGREVL